MYVYDKVDRLTGWWIAGTPDTTRYWYDAVGNRRRDTLSWKAGWYSYGDAGGIGPNRLMSHRDSNVVGHLPNMLTTYSYDADGGMTGRTRVDYGNLTTTGEACAYSYRNLVRRYRSGPGGGIASEEWRYRASANGEREQKRMYWHALDTLGTGYRHPWVYYLQGASKEQLAVWHGVETCDSLCGSVGERVYLYPVAYNTYGAGRTIALVTKNDTTRTYVLSDHLGSSRVRLNASGAVTGTTDYAPFGEAQSTTGQTPRLTYIDKERDPESGLGDYGVRKYDALLGRFMQVDPLWEKFKALSPYSYSNNTPLLAKDPSGAEYYVDDRGWIQSDMKVNDQNDPSVYMVTSSGKQQYIGSMGGKINLDVILVNLIRDNAADLRASTTTLLTQGDQYRRLAFFHEKVKTGGAWDLKNNKNSIVGLANLHHPDLYQFAFGGTSMRAQDVGNFHYGAVGVEGNVSLTFKETLLLSAAGLAQVMNHTSKGMEWRNSYFDDPVDQYWIRQGFRYVNPR